MYKLKGAYKIMEQNKLITKIKMLIYQALYELYDECISSYLDLESDKNHCELMSIHNDFYALKIAIGDVLINKNTATLTRLINWKKKEHPIVYFGENAWSLLLKYFELLEEIICSTNH